jgi:O-antigen ligase
MSVARSNPASSSLDEGRSFDVTAYLSLWVVFLFGISARQVLPGFGAIGSPALILLLPAGLWWMGARLVPTLSIDRQPSVLRRVLLIHLWYLLLSFAITRTRHLTELEASGSTRATVLFVGLVALALLVADGVSSIDRLRTLLRRVVWGTAFMAFIGTLQFVTGNEWQFMLPGLTWNGENFGAGIETRSIFNRPRGTALHPIEFSVVTAAVLPIGIYLAGCEQPGPRRQALIGALVVIGVALPLSLSRSGIVALAVVLAVMYAGWTWRQRLNALIVGVVAIPVLWMVVPGLVGTIRAMFTWFDDDPSIQSRRNRVPRIVLQFRQNPWFGLGNGTWSLDDYFLLDNEFYRTALEIGVIGLVTTALVIGTGLALALTVRIHAEATPEMVAMGYALAAAIAGITLSVFTFDAFHYRILTGLLYLCLGAAGALHRLARDHDALPGSEEPDPRSLRGDGLSNSRRGHP